jgi:hypothetical protein
MPHALHSIFDHWCPQPATNNNQQQQQQGEPVSCASAAQGVHAHLPRSTGSMSTPGHQRTTQHSTARQGAAAGTAGLSMSRKQVSTWMQQQVPVVLARKRGELQNLQSLQVDLKGLQSTLSGLLGGRTAERTAGRTAGGTAGTAGSGRTAGSSTVPPGGAAPGGSRAAGREVLMVFGSLQACLAEELESLQVQVEALDSQLHNKAL